VLAEPLEITTLSDGSMKHKSICLVATAAAWLVSLPAAGGQLSHADFYAAELGTLNCGQLLNATKTEVGRAEVADWLNGFVTGYNAFNGADSISPPDNPTAIAFANKFCANNPLSNIIAAGAVLVQDLGGKPVAFKYEH